MSCNAKNSMFAYVVQRSWPVVPFWTEVPSCPSFSFIPEVFFRMFVLTVLWKWTKRLQLKHWSEFFSELTLWYRVVCCTRPCKFRGILSKAKFVSCGVPEEYLCRLTVCNKLQANATNVFEVFASVGTFHKIALISVKWKLTMNCSLFLNALSESYSKCVRLWQYLNLEVENHSALTC